MCRLVAGRRGFVLQQFARGIQHAVGDLAGIDLQRAVLDGCLDRLDVRRVDIGRAGRREAAQMLRQSRQADAGVARTAGGGGCEVVPALCALLFAVVASLCCERDKASFNDGRFELVVESTFTMGFLNDLILITASADQNFSAIAPGFARPSSRSGPTTGSTFTAPAVPAAACEATLAGGLPGLQSARFTTESPPSNHP